MPDQHGYSAIGLKRHLCAGEYGLADQLGNVDYVAREVVKAEEVIDYTRRENVAEKLAKKFGAAMGDASVRALRSVPALR